MKNLALFILGSFLTGVLLTGCGSSTESGTKIGKAGTEEFTLTAEADSGADESSAGSMSGETDTDSAESAAETDAALTPLQSAMQLNDEVYAWISITGTDISYPVLQPTEDEYFYLSHNLNREEDTNGCIYTEYCNNRDFGDPNTVIYGRNTDAMFGKLHRYQDRDFFDTHKEITVELPDKTLTYRVFAAYTYDDRHLIATYDFWDKAVYSQYLKDVFSIRAMDAFLDDSPEVTAEDKIITLSTGVTGQDDRRYLVQAVLED